MTDWEPATEAEAAMREALRNEDQEAYFQVLARTELLLPVSADTPAGTGGPLSWGTWTTGGRTHVLAFTSAAALQACLAQHAGSTRHVPYTELATGWPNPDWWLAVNPGLPIEGYLPAWFVAQLSRGDVRLPGRTMGARARLMKAENANRARATASVPGMTRPSEDEVAAALAAPGAHHSPGTLSGTGLITSSEPSAGIERETAPEPEQRTNWGADFSGPSRWAASPPSGAEPVSPAAGPGGMPRRPQGAQPPATPDAGSPAFPTFPASSTSPFSSTPALPPASPAGPSSPASPSGFGSPSSPASSGGFPVRPVSGGGFPQDAPPNRPGGGAASAFPSRPAPADPLPARPVESFGTDGDATPPRYGARPASADAFPARTEKDGLPRRPLPDPGSGQPGTESSTPSADTRPPGFSPLPARAEPDTSLTRPAPDALPARPDPGAPASRPLGGADSPLSRPGGEVRPGGSLPVPGGAFGGGFPARSTPGGGSPVDALSGRPDENTIPVRPGGGESLPQRPAGGESLPQRPGGGQSLPQRPVGTDASPARPESGGSATFRPAGSDAPSPMPDPASQRPDPNGFPQSPAPTGLVQRPGAGGLSSRSDSGGPSSRPDAGGSPERSEANGLPQRPDSGGLPQRPEPNGFSSRPDAAGTPQRPDGNRLPARPDAGGLPAADSGPEPLPKRPPAGESLPKRPSAADAFAPRPSAAEAFAPRPSTPDAPAPRPSAAEAFGPRPSAADAFAPRPSAADAFPARPAADSLPARPAGADPQPSRPGADSPAAPDALSRPGFGSPNRPGAEPLPSRPAGDPLPTRPDTDSLSTRPGGDALPSRPGADALSSRPGGDALPSRPGDPLPSRPGDALPSRPGDPLPSRPGDALPSRPGADPLPSRPTSPAAPEAAASEGAPVVGPGGLPRRQASSTPTVYGGAVPVEEAADYLRGSAHQEQATPERAPHVWAAPGEAPAYGPGAPSYATSQPGADSYTPDPDRPFSPAPTPAYRPESQSAPPPDLGGFAPANEVEHELLAAAGDGSTDSFLSTLLLARVLLPLRPGSSAAGGRPGDPDFAWRTDVIDGERYVVVYTSPERMTEHLFGGEAIETVSVKFAHLIRNWPDPGLSFAVNPGSPVGATLPGSQIVALASWAKEVGLGEDGEPEEAIEPTPEPVRVADTPAPMSVPPDPDVPTVMQKAVAPEQVDYFLSRGYDRVSGFLHRADEVEHLATPAALMAALGLVYPGSPFRADADEVHVLRWPAYRPSLYRIPYGGQSEPAMRAMEGWVIERPPFRGNGFAPGDSSDVIAEFKVDSVRLPHGSELWRVDRTGRQTLLALLDTDAMTWRKVGEN